MTDQQFSTVTFKEAYNFVLRGLLPALGIGIAAAVVAFFATRDPVPIYRSTAILLATRPTSGYSSTANVIEPAQIDPDIYRAAVMQGGLLENALARVFEGVAPSAEQMTEWRRKVRVRVDEGLISGLVRVEVEDHDAVLAATVANTVSSALLAWDRDRVGRNVQETVASLDRSVAMIGAQLAVAEMNNDSQTIQVLRATQEQRIAQLRAAEAMRLSAVALGLLEQFRSAEPGEIPVNDRTVFSSAIAFALGLIFAYLIMFFRRVTDGRVRSAIDVVRTTGYDVVAEVPRATGSSGFSESIGRLCIALLGPTAHNAHRAEGSPPESGRAFLFTAPSESRERSLLARHTAAAYASGGWRVLLVDADISRGAVSDLMPSTQAGASLIRLLKGAEGLETTTLSSNQGSTLAFIPVGAEFGESGAVLLSRQIGSLVRSWRSQYEIVIIDSPSLAESAAALTVISEVDEVVVAVTRLRTRLDALRNAVQSLLGKGTKGPLAVLAEPTKEPRHKQPTIGARSVSHAPAQTVASPRVKVVERGRKRV